MQIKKRLLELISFGEKLNEQEVLRMVEFSLRDDYCRHASDFLRFLYFEYYDKIRSNLKIRNTVSLYQNLHEYLIIINAWDLKYNKQLSLNVINHLLKVRFIRTGGIDQWELKRLSNLICEIIVSYKSPKVTLDFLSLLMKSPLRIAFYCEFNLNPYFIRDPALIGLTGNDKLPLNDTHFYDFVTQNLGINYTSNFSDDFNTRLAKNIQVSDHVNGFQIVVDLIRHSVGSDFNYFAMSLIDLCKELKIDDYSIKILDEIIFDYHRCIAANIQRILAKHKELLVRELDFGDKDFVKFTKAKHEYKFLWILNKMMIEEIVQLMKNNNLTDKANEFESKYLSLYAEVMKIPMPSSIPKYLKSDEAG